jgi:CTP:molybdopterin cytidylyltransferase MocA
VTEVAAVVLAAGAATRFGSPKQRLFLPTVLDALRAGGVEIINDVVLNQVLVRVVDGPTTDEVMRRVRDGGEAWMSGTQWRGETAMRLSVSNWQTGEYEVDLALESFRRAAAQAPAQAPAR